MMQGANTRSCPAGALRGFALAYFVLLAALAAPLVCAQGAGATPAIKLTFQSMIGGDFETGTVTVAQPVPPCAPGTTPSNCGLKVQVTSGSKDAKIAPFTPASLLIPPGQTTIQFQIISSPIKTPETVEITACAPSPSPNPCPLTLPPGMIETNAQLALGANGPASVSTNPSTVIAGSSATGTVTLRYPAPKDVWYYKNIAPFGAPKVYVKTLRAGGATVTLTGSGGATVPASINVSSGGSSATFTAGTLPSAASSPQASSCIMGPSTQTASITATWEQTASGTLQIQPQSNNKSRYTSKTIRIDPSTIVGISHDGLVLALISTQCSRLLKEGSVMFVNGLGVLDVGKVATFPSSQAFLSLLSQQQMAEIAYDKTTGVPQGGIVVGVSSASLTDFINEGNVQIYFHNLGAASEPGGANGPFEVAADPNSEQPPGESPWKYTTSGDSDHYTFTAFKQNGGLSGSVTANGEISNGGYNFMVVIHDDKVEKAEFTAEANVKLDVDWMAQTTAPGQSIGESRLRMHPLFSGLVDGPDNVPFLFQIDGNLIFKPGFGEKAAAQGHFEFIYKGEGGIDGATAVSNGFDAIPQFSSTTDSARAANGAVIAVNAPKFALSFSDMSFLWAAANRLPAVLKMKAADFADSFEAQLGAHPPGDVKYPQPDDYFKLKRAAWVMWVSSVGYAGAGMMAMLPCQQYYQTYLVQANIDEDMLGEVSGSKPPEDDLEVFKKTGISAIPSIKGCYPHDQASGGAK
jgi:hypothetical protein